MSPHLSRHVDNDDPRHWRFERSSGLPIGYFPRESWWTRFANRLVFWVPFVGLALALIFQW